MSEIIYMTAEGIARMEAELSQLKTEERPAVVQAIAEARDKGDLSENAEYAAAKEAQVILEHRISRLEMTLARAREIDPTQLDLSAVRQHCRVRVTNRTLGRDMEFTLVSEGEANFKEGKLSVKTPIAQALLGRKVGDVVEVNVPTGVHTYEILDIGL